VSGLLFHKTCLKPCQSEADALLIGRGFNEAEKALPLFLVEGTDCSLPRRTGLLLSGGGFFDATGQIMAAPGWYFIAGWPF
jgi:hypothetical protein